MKKAILITLFLSGSIFAQTTMCFKENHTSMSTIEDTKLDGGECKGMFSISEMKSKNWQVEDIKITTKNDKYNFIYILKKDSNKVAVPTTLSEEELEKRISKRIELKKEQEEKEKLISKKIENKEKGKELYVKKCSSCHGKKGEIAAGRSLPLNKISLEDMKFMIARYTNDFDYGKGQETLMRPYAVNTNNIELEKMYDYLESLN